MEKLRSQIMIITLVTVVSTVLLCIVPQSKVRQAFKILCALVIVYAAVAPLGAFDFDSLDFSSFFESEETSKRFSEKKDEASLLAANEGISKAASGLMNENGLQVENVKAQCEIRENEIIVLSITVYCSLDKNGQSKARSILKQISSEETEIRFICGEENEKS